MSVLRLVGLSLLPIAISVTALPAQPSEHVLGRPVWAALEGLSSISGLGLLSDGRVLIADARERQLYVAGRNGELKPTGSTGDGPGEYRSVFSVTRVRGDSLYVLDSRSLRFLRFAPDGRQADDLVIPLEVWRSGGVAPISGADARGRLYWVGDAISMSDGIPSRAAVHRVRAWAPGDTFVRIVAPVRDHSDDRHGQRFHPLAWRDAHVVAPDGGVGVVSSMEQRLVWYRDGQRTRSEPRLEFPRLPITRDERDAYRAQRAGQSGTASTRAPGVPSGSGGTSTRSRDASFLSDDLFPSTMPPFDADGVLRSPEGDVWVSRSASAGARERIIDILSDAGVRTGFVRVPADRRLIALERGGVFLARTDDDGLEWLERYDYPRAPR